MPVTRRRIRLALLGGLLFVALFWSVLFAQSNQARSSALPPLPSVYVDYVKTGLRTSLHTDESTTGIWLRLHNNTRWSLVLPAFEVPKKNGDAGLFYEVRSVSGTASAPVGERPGHMQSSLTVVPGGKIDFSVPAEHLKKDLAIAVRFNYAWESQQLALQGKEPEHWVIFEAKELREPRKP